MSVRCLILNVFYHRGVFVLSAQFGAVQRLRGQNATSYTKAEAAEMVDGIMESLLSFGWGDGELKNRAGVLLNYFNKNTDWFDSQSVNFLSDFIQ